MELEHNQQSERQSHEFQDSAAGLANFNASTSRTGRRVKPRSNTFQSTTKRIQDSPSAGTGPPRSLSFSFSLSHSQGLSPGTTYHTADETLASDQGSELVFDSISGDANFRGVLDNDRKGKQRALTSGRVHDSPIEERERFDWGTVAATNKGLPPTDELSTSNTTPHVKLTSPPSSPSARTRRSYSAPHVPSEGSKTGAVKWNRLRLLLPHLKRAREPPPDLSAVTSQSVNITDELITGGLSGLMLQLWFQRDDSGRRRVPILLHRLRIRVSDSLHPLHGQNTVFRIECEYANGAARWVIYRQLRDFIALHTHYTLSNAYTHDVDRLPHFPRTSLPYFKFLRKEASPDGKKMGRQEFARIQREALENYLIELIRAVMFHSSADRLCGFLEISSLFIALARSGGAQYKAGFLRIQVIANNGGGFGRKSSAWRNQKTSKWCAVRESYLVVLEEPGELDVWDVFLIDSDFKIERPKRYFRRGLSFFHSSAHENSRDQSGHPIMQPHYAPQHNLSVLESIKSWILQPWGRSRSAAQETNGNALASVSQHIDHAASSSSSIDTTPSRPPTPILDPSTNTNPLLPNDEDSNDDPVNNADAKSLKQKKKSTSDVSKHTFYIENSQTRLKLVARNERQMLQWITALEKVAATSHYFGKNRFDSFVPIRLNASAQWLIDGRDYMWNISRALLLARETILIHDWWLSPELQLRRPNKARYRLDRLLEKKAKEGVKIYIILYQEVSSRTTPTDSNYAKQKLVSLHPNIMIQRSPSHLQTGTFYWAHHEKLCVVDHTIAFMGGIDLCFGRWDTPQHVLVDDPEPDTDHSEIWPGKDYSNPRIRDFYDLGQPAEDMYDRAKVPRMPWHDVGLQVVGQPARDLTRHFVQRWNFLLRIKNHSRVMPFLLPPAEFKSAELAQLGLSGTCEMQICRSAGPWSMGTPGRIEHSIQNAYLKAIQMSEHFVYIENQFFITSTIANDVKIENRIGDALVHRIIRAHRENTPWKCCIMLPVMPGFSFPVHHGDASALRIIMELQKCTISRGPNSLFVRLRKAGINPNDYIAVFALRNWARLRGDVLTTEQVYIHSKIMIVDDRLAIIGSANINERSLRGDRDSELAAVIRDTDMIDSTMAGKPFKVGRFAHTLRVRLMQEHIGVDVDALPTDDLMTAGPVIPEFQQPEWDPNSEQESGRAAGVTHIKSQFHSPIGGLANVAAVGAGQALHAASAASTRAASKLFHMVIPNGDGQSAGTPQEGHTADIHTSEESQFTNSGAPTPEETATAKELFSITPTNADTDCLDPAPHQRAFKSTSRDPSQEGQRSKPSQAGIVPDGADEKATDAKTMFRKHLASKFGDRSWTAPIPTVPKDPKIFDDPISDEFWYDVWVAAAVHNTEVYRRVFHAIPDDSVTTWREYTEFVEHHERLNMPTAGPATPEPVGNIYDSAVEDTITPQQPGQTPQTPEHIRGPKPFEKWERDEMDEMLETLCGHLVVYPHRFLEKEDTANNFLFNADRLLPMPIYD